MMKNFKLFFVLFFSIVMGVSAQTKQLAFPGAEGWGRFATGGRNGQVYHVTNLNDTGEGSLRDAVSKPNRIVVFDVAGVIRIKSKLSFAANLYLAGQTAPGEGVTVYGDCVSFSKASNLICRYMRFRMGKVGTADQDAATISSGRNMIFDHVSVSWGRDETFSINNNFDPADSITDITIQNSIIAQGLQSHSAGGLIQGYRISLYRNLYASNNTRNTKVKGTNQYVNCIVYNWNDGGYLMGGNSMSDHYANLQHSLFINGPAGSRNGISDGNHHFHLYAEGNMQDRDCDGEFNPYLIPESEYVGGPDFKTEPYPYPVLPTCKADELVDVLLPNVGASLPHRDLTDSYVIAEVLSFGKKGELIGDEAQLPYGTPDKWSMFAGEKPADTDGDGMPDAWEIAKGLNPNADDAMAIGADGYANIENYINSITADDSQYFLRKPYCLEVVETAQDAATIEWMDFTSVQPKFIVEVLNGEEWQKAAEVEAGKTAVTLTGLQPLTSYSVRVCAVDGDVQSDYSSTLTFKTRRARVDMVDCKNFEADYKWNTADGSWNSADANWLNAEQQAAAWANGKSALFNTDAAITVTNLEAVEPATVVVNGAGKVTFTGEAIQGAATVNKDGEGTLELGSSNTYTGATVMHAGTTVLSKLANGGEASSIGAASADAANWIWNGGTWQCTGASESTNRSAIVYAKTALEIAKGKNLTMTGSIEGDGDVALTGAGKLTVNSNNFFQYTGATILQNGTLGFGSHAISLVGIGNSSKLIMAGGTIECVRAPDANNYEILNFPIYVEPGTDSYINCQQYTYLDNAVSGSGTLHITNNYIREYIRGDWTNFTGKVIAKGTYKSGNDLSIFGINNTTGGIPNCVLQLEADIRVMDWEVNSEKYIGGLSGAAGTYLSGTTKNNANATMIWHVGGANTDETFNGVIDRQCYQYTKKCHVTIIKEGYGLWRLNGNNLYDGTTTVNAGTLCVNGTHTGGGAYTVNSEAVLKGKGTIPSTVTVKNGGAIIAGDEAVADKTLTVKGALKLEQGSSVGVSVNKNALGMSNDYITAGSSVTIANGVVLTIDLRGKELVNGEAVRVFKVSSGTAVQGTFSSIEPAQPAEGLFWDDSQLYTTGVLYVRDQNTTGIRNEKLSGEATVTYYNLSGQQLSAPQRGMNLVRTVSENGVVTTKRVLIK